MSEETNPFIIQKIYKENEFQRLNKIVEKLKIKYKEEGIKELIDMRQSLTFFRDFKQGNITQEEHDQQADLYDCLWDVIRDKFDSKAFQIRKVYCIDNPVNYIWIAEDKGYYYWLSFEDRDDSLPFEIPKYLYKALLQFKSEYEDYINQEEY